MAGALSRLISKPPEPVSSKAEVVSSVCRGRRKMRLHVLPAAEAGMSKLKIEDTTELMVPL